MNESRTVFLELDRQRRISLARYIPKSATGYLTEFREDGSVLLRPATPVPDVIVSPEVMGQADAGFAAVASGKNRRHG